MLLGGGIARLSRLATKDGSDRDGSLVDGDTQLLFHTHAVAESTSRIFLSVFSGVASRHSSELPTRHESMAEHSLRVDMVCVCVCDALFRLSVKSSERWLCWRR